VDDGRAVLGDAIYNGAADNATGCALLLELARAWSAQSPRPKRSALFLAVTIVMLAAWWGTRALALALFAVTLVACVATYLHHASDVLKLSF